MFLFPDHQQSIDSLLRKAKERSKMPTNPQRMKASFLVTTPRIFAFAAALLLPLTAVGCGIFLLLNHALVSLSFLTTFLLLPAGTIFFLKKLIFASVAAFAKALAAILLLISFFSDLLFCACWKF